MPFLLDLIEYIWDDLTLDLDGERSYWRQEADAMMGRAMIAALLGALLVCLLPATALLPTVVSLTAAYFVYTGYYSTF